MNSVKTNGKIRPRAVTGIGVHHVDDELVKHLGDATARGPGTSEALRVPSTISAVTAATTIVISSAEFVYDTSTPPIWSGTSRWISNCSQRVKLHRDLFLVSSHLSFGASLPGSGAPGVRYPTAVLTPVDRAVDIEHAGRDPEEEHHDRHPGRGARPAIDRPAQPRRDDDRDHQLDPDAQPGSHSLLQARVVGAGPRLGRAPWRAPVSGARQDAPVGPAARFRSCWGAQHRSVPAVRPERGAP